MLGRVCKLEACMCGWTLQWIRRLDLFEEVDQIFGSYNEFSLVFFFSVTKG